MTFGHQWCLVSRESEHALSNLGYTVTVVTWLNNHHNIRRAGCLASPLVVNEVTQFSKDFGCAQKDGDDDFGNGDDNDDAHTSD